MDKLETCASRGKNVSQHVFELGLGKVRFDGLCPKVNALLSSNEHLGACHGMRISKQTQLQGVTITNILHTQMLI